MHFNRAGTRCGSNRNPKRRLHLAGLLAFAPLTALVLFCDSLTVARYLSHGQWLSDGLTLIYWAVLVGQMRGDRKLPAVLFVPLSALGECIFALLLRLYHYRLTWIPLYVPLGHAVILSAAIGFTDLPWVVRRTALLRNLLLAFHALAIGATVALKADTFSLLLGVGFFWALLRSREPNLLYLVVGALVLYVELLGTFWGCWQWHPRPLGLLHTCNPPPGAFVCYVVAEIGAIKVSRRLERWWRRHAALPHGEAAGMPYSF